jgi:cysteine sulfinate desulfinase/cysteine desulfurase-like protein
MSKKTKKITYLDYASATPIDLNVKKSMDSTRFIFANPSAIHTSGVKSRHIIVSECESEDLDVNFWHELPKPPCH